MTHLKRETLFQFGHCAVSSSFRKWLNFYLSRLLLVSSVKWKHPFGSFQKKTLCKEIKWFPWNYWPFITNNAIAITSVLLHQYNGFDVPEMRERERERFVKKMKDKHNSNTKHLIAYSIQLLLSIFCFALSWRSLAMTHAVNTPGSQLISFKVNNSVCKLIIYYRNRIFFDTFDRSNIQHPESVNEVSMPAKKEEVWTLFNFSYRLFTIIQE